MSVSIKKSGIINAEGSGINPNLIKSGLGYVKGSTWVNDGVTMTVENGVFKLVSGDTANKRVYDNTVSVWTSGQAYTVSFLAKAAAAGVVINMSRSTVDFTSNFTLTTDWKYYTGTINSTATADGGTLSIRLVTANATVYLKYIKLEKGTIATPWIPHTEDPEYNGTEVAFLEQNPITKYGKDYIYSNEIIEI